MKAAVLGGLVAGVPSALPLISICCLIWAIGGGFLAVFVYMKGAPTAMTPGDGAKLGMRAGIVGAIAYIAVGLLMTLLGGALQFASMPTGGEGAGVAALAAGLGIFAVFIGAAFVFGLTIAGGAIGAAVLGKNRPGGTGTPPPPPPTDYTGSGYGGTGVGGGYGGTTPGGGYGGGTTPTGPDFGETPGGGTAGGGTPGTGGTGSTFGSGS